MLYRRWRARAAGARRRDRYRLGGCIRCCRVHRRTSLLASACRASPPGRPLSPGQQLRMLGVRREDDPDLDAPMATLTSNSELFVVVGGSA